MGDGCINDCRLSDSVCPLYFLLLLASDDRWVLRVPALYWADYSVIRCPDADPHKQ